MQGSREQRVVLRFQQHACASDGVQPCRLLGKATYYDTFWWSNGLGRSKHSGPATPPAAELFYATLLESRRWWASCLLPSSSLCSE